MFDEMRTFADREPCVSARTVVQMATLNGAHALGFGGRAGELKSGAWADLIAVPVSAKASKVHEAVLQHRGNVAASMIDGCWVMPPV